MRHSIVHRSAARRCLSRLRSLARLGRGPASPRACETLSGHAWESVPMRCGNARSDLVCGCTGGSADGGLGESGGSGMDVLIAHGGKASRRSLDARRWRPWVCAYVRRVTVRRLWRRCSPRRLPRWRWLSWDLPRIEGPELCRLVRDFHVVNPPYVLLLAGSAHGDEVTLRLEAGAHGERRAHAGHGERASCPRRDGASLHGTALQTDDAGVRRRARRSPAPGGGAAPPGRRARPHPPRARGARRRDPRRGRSRARQRLLRPLRRRRRAP